MAGFRTFATGEVLTAANVNDFLMKQSVMVFADAAARTAALGAEVTEGMLTFNKDTGQLEVFDGTNFVVAAPTPGKLVAVHSVTKTSAFSSSVAAASSVAVTGLSISSVALSDASNKLIIMAFFGTAGNNSGNGACGLAVSDGTNLLTIGDVLSNRTRVTAGGIMPSASVASVFPTSATYVHSPGDTTSRTYSVHAVNINEATKTLFVNRQEFTVNDQNRIVAASGLTIMEVRP